MRDLSCIPVFASVREVHTVCLPSFPCLLGDPSADAFWATYLVVPDARKYSVIRISGLGVASTEVRGVTLQGARAFIRKHSPSPWRPISDEELTRKIGKKRKARCP